MTTLTPPKPLTDHHIIEPFSCGEPSLDRWLQQRALKNESRRASRTYVICIDNQVVGYYALAVGSIAARQAPRKIKQNMPDPIPVMVLGRLAVDTHYQGKGQRKGLGDALLRDAILRVLQAADIAGIKAILVHALSDQVKRFYEDRSFIASTFDSMTLFLPLDSLNNLP